MRGKVIFVYQFKQFTFDPILEKLSSDAHTHTLRPKVAKLLQYFLDNPEQLLSREQILNELWQHSQYRDSALTQSIQELRKTLGDDAQQPEFIKTVPQKGYMWIAPVEVTITPNIKSAPQRKGLSIAITIALSASVIGSAIWYTNIHTPTVAEHVNTQALPSIFIAPVENLTGQGQLDWWGFALQQQLKQATSAYFNVIDEVSAAGVSLENVVQNIAEVGFSAKLTQQQQRYVLHYQINRRGQSLQQGQLVSEDLQTPIDELVSQLVMQLSGHTEAVSTEKISANVQSRQSYLGGLHALSYQGVGAAIPYFRAALVHDIDNQVARLELANALWKTGMWQASREHFEAIKNIDATSYLATRYHLYLGRYWLNMGEYERVTPLLERTIAMARALNHQRLLAQGYQLQADLAWLQLRWQAHSKAMHSAKVLLGAGSLSHSESQRAFYLANPPQAGVEQSTELDMSENLAVVQKAIRYYRQQQQLAPLMLSYFALGQNYLAPLAAREQALKQALTMADSQNNLYVKNDILLYMAFYYIQLHDGDGALRALAQLKAEDTPRIGLQVKAQFLTAMATMDRVLQETMPSEGALNNALTHFKQLLGRTDIDKVTQASAQLMNAWLLIKQQAYERAKPLLERAGSTFEQLQLTDSLSYVRYTQMYIRVSQGQYQDAIAMLAAKPVQKLEALYGSFALTRLGQHQAAAKQLQAAKQQFASQWQQQDDDFFEQVVATASSQSLHLELLPPPYSVYCQSEWRLE
ncbi:MULTISPECIES: winged helix-turn-helix domain-containing protein [Pseudoalteromonas]|uniref:winged helix-turn-helix domain-containing protein n=1 Tax=Pseudoalteromonas TaxID=53246 RepID=UPI00147F4B63|nr:MULTISPECIES: winged helix-turn-helix domain-containing protein [Pseudoalteromonas]